MSLPLSGITVLSLEQAISAPLGSRHLADWGARVIKIERPDSGDFARGYDATMHGLSSQFAWANRFLAGRRSTPCSSAPMCSFRTSLRARLQSWGWTHRHWFGGGPA